MILFVMSRFHLFHMVSSHSVILRELATILQQFATIGRKSRRIPLALIVLLAFGLKSPSPAHGGNQDESSFVELSLEELLNTVVTTATRTEKPRAKAPAIMTVIHARQLQDMGLIRLSQVLDFVPGFTQMDTYWKPDIISVRGIRPSLYNDKVLLLINGVPQYDAASLEFSMNIIPIQVVDRIEILRGPGSTLYGTNAFAGVIHVITSEEEIQSAEILVGSHQTRGARCRVQESVQGLQITLAADLIDDDGYRKQTVDEWGQLGSIAYEKDLTHLFAQIQSRHVTLDMGTSRRVFGKFGPAPVFDWSNQGDPNRGRGIHNKWFTHLRTEWTFGRATVNASLRYDDTDKQSDLGSYGSVYGDMGVLEPEEIPEIAYYRFAGQVWGLECQGRFSLQRDASLIVGATTENRRVSHLADLSNAYDGEILYSGASRDLPFSARDTGAYVQLESASYRTWQGVMGLRASFLDAGDQETLSPRAGLVFSAHPEITLKGLYGEAFRSPGPQEQVYRVPHLIYGPEVFGRSLKPERIKTAEVSLEWKPAPSLSWVLNSYHARVEDLIGRRDPGAEEIAQLGESEPLKIYDNLGEHTVHGMECELSMVLERLHISHLFFNAAYQRGKDQASHEIPFLARWTSQAGITWTPSTTLRLSGFYRFVDSRKGTMSDGRRLSVDPYHIADFNLEWSPTPKATLGVTCQNAANERYVYPEFVRQNIDTIPGGPGRTWLLRASYAF